MRRDSFTCVTYVTRRMMTKSTHLPAFWSLFVTNHIKVYQTPFMLCAGVWTKSSRLPPFWKNFDIAHFAKETYQQETEQKPLQRMLWHTARLPRELDNPVWKKRAWYVSPTFSKVTCQNTKRDLWILLEYQQLYLNTKTDRLCSMCTLQLSQGSAWPRSWRLGFAGGIY